jgi:general secretion pathway protein A
MRSFSPTPVQEEALARLHFLVEQRRRLGLLFGPPGSGKSLLLEVLADQLRRSGRAAAKVTLAGAAPAEALWAIAAALGCNLDRQLPPQALWNTIADRLAEFRYQGADVAVLLDDADQCQSGALPYILRLAKHDPSPARRLTVILCGQPECMARLGESLLGLAGLRVDLDRAHHTGRDATLAHGTPLARRSA